MKLFPIFVKKVVNLVIGDSDRDVSYIDSLDVRDQLAGTLGPVVAPDTLDLGDTFAADNFSLGDTLDAADALRAVEGLVAADSLAVADNLAGTLGPVVAPDTLDLSDVLDAGPLTLGDSFAASDAFGAVQQTQVADSLDLADRLAGTLGPVVAPDSLTVSDNADFGSLRHYDSLAISDAPRTPELEARASDSIDISDRFGPLYQVEDDSLHITDALRANDAQVADSIAVADALDSVVGPDLQDSLAISDTADAALSTDIPDSMDFADVLRANRARAADSVDITDARKTANVTTARLWPNTVVSNSNFTNPANFADTNESSAASLTIAQTSSLVSGSSRTLSGTLVVSCADLNITPSPSITSVTVTMAWQTQASGGLQSGNSVNVNLDYSLDDGASWTTLATVTAVASSGAPSAVITPTYAQLNQLRFRATGSVTSGTTAVLGGATQTFNAGWARVQFNASQTL